MSDTSNNYSIENLREYKAIYLNWSEYAPGDIYVGAFDKVCEELTSKGVNTLVINRKSDYVVDSNDRKWMVKTGISNLIKAGLTRVVFIVPEDQVNDKNNRFPFAEFSDKFKISKISDIDKLSDVIKKEIVASEEISKLTKQQALEYMGLPADANDYIIDEKFWQLSKKLRGEADSEQKLADLSDAYDIATGRRDERAKKVEIREKSNKILGKTAAEWENHFHYSWYKYLIGIVLVAVFIDLAYNIFFKPRYDVSVASVGHFIVEDDQLLENELIRLGFERPYLNMVDVVVLNDQGEVETAYEDNSTSTLFLSQPNLIVTDLRTAPYYFSYFVDISAIYEEARIELTDSQFAHIKPVYCSEREYYTLMRDYDLAKYDSTDYEDLSIYGNEPIMIGIMVDDPDWITRLGYVTTWPNDEPNLVLGIYNDTKDYSNSESIILGLLRTL